MSSDSNYPTGVYVKGDQERVANRPSQAVSLVFEGYVLKTEEVAEPTLSDTVEAPGANDDNGVPSPGAGSDVDLIKASGDDVTLVSTDNVPSNPTPRPPRRTRKDQQ